jgi:Leucine-rich repeat (LRR) protein
MASLEEIYKKMQEEKKKKEDAQKLQEQLLFDEQERQRQWMIKDRMLHERIYSQSNTQSNSTSNASSSSSSSSAGGHKKPIVPPTPPTPTYQPFIIQLSIEANEQISIPTLDGYIYDCTIDWGDSTPTTYISTWDDTGNTHTYTDAGVYILSINGLCEAFSVFCNNNLSDDITDIISWGNVGLKQLDFQSCTELVSIPNDTYGGFSLITNFWGTFFNCTKLTAIPSGLFNYAVNVTNLDYAFNNCLLVSSIPSGLFNNNTLITSFDATFRHLESITSIPSGLFNNCPNVTNFNSTFQYCRELTSIPVGLFDNCPNVTSFQYTFEHCRSLRGLVPTLWLSYPTADGYNCFYNDVSVTNFNSIPESWGGVPTPTFMTFNVDTTYQDWVYINYYSDLVWFEWSDGFIEFNNYTYRENLTGDTYTIIVSGETSIIENIIDFEISGAIINWDGIRYIKNTEYLSIYDTSISTLTLDMLKGLTNVTYFNLDNNQYFDTLEGVDILRALPNLKEFQFGYNILTILPNDLFKFNPLLTEIEISDNDNLVAIPNDLFKFNPLSTEIEISDNDNLVVIPSDLFKYNPLLNDIEIEYNEVLTTLPSNLFKDLNIQDIEIYQNNSLTTIESYAFNNIDRYYDEYDDEYYGDIEIEYNHQINLIDSYAFNNVKTDDIYIYSNYDLTTLKSNTFNNCIIYEDLDLEYLDGLLTIEDDAFYGSSINELNIYELNSLSYISDNAFRNTDIKELSIRYTDLTGITNINFSYLTGLTELKISYCDNLNIGDVIKNLPNLEILNLEANELIDNVVTTFDGLSSVKELYLNYNDYTNIDFIQKFPNLIVLEVGWNYLTEIPANISGLTQLQSLNISAFHGPLNDVIKDMPNLNYIYIYGDFYRSGLTSISAATFTNLPKFIGTDYSEINISYNGLSSIEIDAFLINIDIAGFSNTYIYIGEYNSGDWATNRTRSSFSNTAHANLISRGCYIDVV